MNYESLVGGFRWIYFRPFITLTLILKWRFLHLKNCSCLDNQIVLSTLFSKYQTIIHGRGLKLASTIQSRGKMALYDDYQFHPLLPRHHSWLLLSEVWRVLAYHRTSNTAENLEIEFAVINLQFCLDRKHRKWHFVADTLCRLLRSGFQGWSPFLICWDCYHFSLFEKCFHSSNVKNE